MVAASGLTSRKREALWERVEGASFLTGDEKRAAAGYGVKDGGPTVKFNNYHVDAGRFTTADGAGSGGSSRDGRVQVAQGVRGNPRVPLIIGRRIYEVEPEVARRFEEPFLTGDEKRAAAQERVRRAD